MTRLFAYFLAVFLGFSAVAEAGRIQMRQAGDVVTMANGDRYILTKALGAGAMGTVYRATKLKSDETIAIKFFSASTRSLDLYHDVLDGFARATELKSPSLISFRLGKLENGETVVLMPVGEKSLRDYLSEPLTYQQRFVAAKEVYDVLQPLLRSLLRSGYHFGDIKPPNIVRVEGQWKVVDFDSLQRLGLVSKIFTSYYAPAEIRRGQPTQWSSDAFMAARTIGEILLGNALPDSILTAGKWSQETLKEIYKRYPQFRKPEFQDMRRFLAASLAESPEERSLRLSRSGFGNACNKVY